MTVRSRIERGLARHFSPLACFRIARDLRQSDLAVHSQIHETIVSKIERGTRWPTELQAKHLARALRTTQRKMAELLADTFFWARANRAGKRARS